MNISQAEQLKLINELIISLNPIFIGIFILGVITGVFFFSNLVQSLDRLSYRFRRPRRIKRSAENGNFEYLYLFKGKYYSLVEFQDLRAKARNKFLNKRNLSI